MLTFHLRFKSNNYFRSSHCGSVEMNPTSIPEDAGLIPGLAQWVKDPRVRWAGVEVAGVARSWPCCSSDSTPSLGTSIKAKKKKKIISELPLTLDEGFPAHACAET